jgi:capsular polysaccharide biosynthesis protein
MRFDTLGTRLRNRLASLPEILFSFTQHWLILTVCLIVGGTAMVAKVSTDSVVYEGKAILLLNTHDTAGRESGRGKPVRERDGERIFSSRVRMLKSDSVLRKIAKDLEPAFILLQDENPDKEGYGPTRRFLSDAKEGISELLAYLEHPTLLDRGQEYELQKAVASLRKRLRVVSDPKTNTLELYVYGNDRSSIRRELDYWIDAYLSRLGGVEDQWRETVLGTRTRFWVRREQKAMEEWQQFQRENPGVSKSAKGLLLQELIELQSIKSDMKRALAAGGATISSLLPGTGVEDADTKWLMEEKLGYLKELIRVTPLYGENSDQVRNIKASMELVDEKLRGIDPAEIADPAQRITKLKENVRRIEAAIITTSKLNSGLETNLKKLEQLEDEYRRAREARLDYELWNELDSDDSEFVAAQIIESPRVHWTPYETYPYRQVLYGSLGSLGLGMAVALLFELLCGKVRFKNDILTEFQVPVVGVIPRK